MQRLIDRIEAAGFQCEAGPLAMNQDWLLLKAELAMEGHLQQKDPAPPEKDWRNFDRTLTPKNDYQVNLGKEAEIHRGHRIWYDTATEEYSCGELNIYRLKTVDAVKEAIDKLCDGAKPPACVDHRICERDDCGRGPNPKCDQYRPETDPQDEMYDQAVTTVREAGTASISMIQRRLRIGYNRAARILEAMEKNGVVTAPAEFGKRDVIGAQKKTCTCPSC